MDGAIRGLPRGGVQAVGRPGSLSRRLLGYSLWEGGVDMCVCVGGGQTVRLPEGAGEQDFRGEHELGCMSRPVSSDKGLNV